MALERGFTPEDYWRLRFITDMRLSPDGNWIAYSQEENDLEANTARSAIWLLNTATGQRRQLTSGLRYDSSPRFAPDGQRLAFMSNRGDSGAQIWTIPLDGGEAQQRTRVKRSVGEPAWAAVGASLYFKSQVITDEYGEDDPDRPRVMTRLQYRWDGKGYLEGRTHLFHTRLTGGEPEQLTTGDVDCGHPVPSPDGRWLAFISDQTDERDANMTTDVLVMDLRTRETRRLTDGQHRISHVSWSPGSDRLAFLAEPKVAAHSAYNVGMHVVALHSGEVADLLEASDRSAEVGLYGDVPSPALSAPMWMENGREIVFLSQRGGGVDVLAADIHTHAIRPLVSVQAHIAQCALSVDGARLFTLQCEPTTPWEIAEYDLSSPKTAKLHALAQVNDELLVDRVVVNPDRFTFRSFDGAEVEAWLYRPARSSGALAPLVLWLHGGPDSAYGFSFYLLAQALTSKGYAVLHMNPRGSTGYGEAFTQAVDYDWGGGDYMDIMAGLDAALSRGDLDGERMAIVGASYGGYLTNWIIGQTERFRAAVSINSVTNLLSCFGTADLDPIWAEGYYGWPWENMEFYLARSPITHAHRVTTPTRIIAAERDYRCPISQSEEWFTWLKKRGKAPVDFVRLPRATHTSFAGPRQRVQRMRLVLDWIDRWIDHTEP